MNTAAWQRKRERIKRRDGYRCRRCGSSENLSVHHRRQVARFGPNTADADLETLCSTCHPPADREARSAEMPSPIF